MNIVIKSPGFSHKIQSYTILIKKMTTTLLDSSNKTSNGTKETYTAKTRIKPTDT